MNKHKMSILMVLLLICGPWAISLADKWDDADRATVRLGPSSFKDLPESVVVELLKKGCAVPQSYSSPSPHNVIQGEFAREGQKDVAILCSNDRSSSIVFVWGGPAACPSEIAKSADRGWLQGIGGGKLGYSRVIQAVGRSTISGYFKTYGGPTPPLIDHDGVDDIFVEKASVVRYCHEGRWRELTGAD